MSVLIIGVIRCTLITIICSLIQYVRTRIDWNDLQTESRKERVGLSGTSLPSLPLGLEHLDPAEVYGLTATTTAEATSAAGAGSATRKKADAAFRTDEKNDQNDDDNDDDEDAMDEEDGSEMEIGAMSGHGKGDNKCVLVWQGIVPKRTFTGFKFQV